MADLNKIIQARYGDAELEIMSKLQVTLYR